MWCEWGNALVNGVTHINIVHEYQGECAFRCTSRDLYMRKPALKKQMLKKRKKQSYQTQCLLHLEERHKYCLPRNTEKCVMNVATVKPSLFLQLKQTECVISWLLLPNPKSQEDYMWFESSSLYLFFTGIFCCWTKKVVEQRNTGILCLLNNIRCS